MFLVTWRMRAVGLWFQKVKKNELEVTALVLSQSIRILLCGIIFALYFATTL